MLPGKKIYLFFIKFIIFNTVFIDGSNQEAEKVPDFPSISTDQIAAFVELANHHSLREAAASLFLTEQGLRNRILALEERLKVSLYRKQRGPRRGPLLTPDGQRFLPLALTYLEQSRQLFDQVHDEQHAREIHVVASQYLILYVLIDAIDRFHRAYPHLRVRLSNRTESEIEEALLNDLSIAVGVAAPYESTASLRYKHLLTMEWSFIAPRNHPLLKRKRLKLEDVVECPLIFFERGSTGRQHVMDAFLDRGLSPRIEMETTNTEIIIRMVEAGLGVSIVPLLANGIVTRGRRVGVRSLESKIRSIHSGLLTRQGEKLSEPVQKFVKFIRDTQNG